MTILELISRWAGASGDLVALLTAAGNAAPDLKPKADEWIDKLGAAVSPENLANLAAALPAEAADILRGHLNPKDHPSDAI